MLLSIISKSELNENEKEAIFQLWNNEYPKQLSYSSISDLNNYLKALSLAHHFLLVNEQNQIQAWATTFVREDEKWLAIIVSSSLQGTGQGTRLLNYIKVQEIVLNGWVIDHNNYTKHNGVPYPSPLPFYLKNGFELISSVRLELETISAVKIKWIK